MAAARVRRRWAASWLALSSLAVLATGDLGSGTNETNETAAANTTDLFTATSTTRTATAAAVGAAAAAASAQALDTLPPARQEGSWDSFSFHLIVCAASWASLLVLSTLLATCRTSWDAERVERRLRSFVQFFTSHKHYLAMSMVFSLGMCVLHVVRAEFTPDLGIWDVLELVVQFPHLLEALLLWLHATARSVADATQLCMSRLIVDCLILPSVLMCGFNVKGDVCFSYVASMRVLVLWQQILDARPNRKGVKLLVAHGMVRLVCAVFCAACLIRQVENFGGPVSAPTDLREVWTLEASAYFVLISVLTVGYSDLSPQTYLGQFLMIFITVLGIWLLLRTLLGIMQAVDSNRGGNGQYDSRRARHIVVTGTPSFQVLRDFLLELYNEDLGRQCEDLNVVLMLLPGQRHVMDQVRHFLRQPSCRRFRHEVWLIQGSALRHEDLKRVNYKDSLQAFLLPNLYAEDMEREDVDNTMRALSMQRYVPFVRIISLLLKAESRDMMRSVGLSSGDIVCVDEVKHGFVAKSCEAQGFGALACGLFKRAGGIIPEMERGEARLVWVQEYLKGLANEIFEVPLCPGYRGAPFGEVALDVMVRSEGAAYLVGIVEEPYFPGDETITSVFPGKNYKVGTRADRSCTGIFVAKSRELICQYPPGTVFPWHIEPESRAQQGAGGKAWSNLPGVVPELVATETREGFVREPRDIKAERAESLVKSSQITAAQFAVQGIRQQTQMDPSKIQAMIGLDPADDIRRDVGKRDGTGPEEDMDPTQRALMAAQFAAEDEVAAKADLAVEKEAMFAARKVVAVAEKIAERRRVLLEISEQEKADDIELWGYPPPQPLKALGSEPPPAQLVRGGHVLVMAIEPPPVGGPAKVAGAGTGDPTKRLGRKLGIIHFVRSLRASGAKRNLLPHAVVVVSETTPRDWAKVSKEEGVYLVLGRPNLASTLKRAGLEQAHAVVVHQRNASMDRDPSVVDTEAILACRLAEEMSAAAGREIPVICDLHLNQNAAFLPFGRPAKPDSSGKDKDKDKDKDKEEDEDPRKKPMDAKVAPFIVQSRFASGHLFVSSITTTLVANMFYKPALGHVVGALLRKQFVVIPLPEEFKGRTFGQLFEHVMRKNNLMPMALLRLKDISDEDLEENEPDELGGEGGIPELNPVVTEELPRHWSPGEPAADRYTKIMPEGDALVAQHDGILCVVATTGRVTLPTVKQPGAIVPEQRGTATGGQGHLQMRMT